MWSRSVLIIPLLLQLLAFSVRCLSTTGDRVLIVTDGSYLEAFQSDYSQFWTSLRERNFQLQFADWSKGDSKLFSHGERTADHLIFYAPSASKWGTWKTDELVEFMEKGGNVFMGASGSAKVQSMVTAFGVKALQPVQDHFNFEPSLTSKDHDVIWTQSLVRRAALLVSIQKPLLVKGWGMELDLDTNALVFPLVQASPTTQFQDGKKKKSQLLGEEIVLACALQARNNARFVLLGSFDSLSDKFLKFDKKPSGNADFMKDVSRWVFQEKAVLRIESIEHYIASSPKEKNGQAYLIKVPIVYKVKLQQWTGDKWVPFILPAGDSIQWSCRMLDPYIRTDLQADNNTLGVYTTPAGLQLPDVYGVFTFHLEYRRRAWTFIENKQQVSIIPLRHDAYPRFLSAAYPYYASMWSMMAGCFLFSILFLFHKDKKQVSGDKKDK